MKNLFWSVLLRGLLVAGLLSGLAVNSAWATHLRAGEITATRLNCSRTFRICITVYVNTNPAETDVKFGGGELRFGDGNLHITPELPSTPYGDPQDFIGKVEYCIDYTYQALGQYKISYNEPNRNAGILNMTNSVGTTFFLETIIEIDPFKGCDNSPYLLVPPIDKACSGAAWFHNPGAYDIDGDSLSYEMIVPRQVVDKAGTVADVFDYTQPSAQKHYGGLAYDYAHANEDRIGPPSIKIDARTGTITWDAPGVAGQYNIAFLIKEWRKLNDTWYQIGSVTRDMQIIVEDCPNNRPELEVPPDVCVEAGKTVTADIFGTDPDFDDVKIEVFSETLILAVSPATYTPKDVFQHTSPQKAKVTFTWHTKCDHVKEQSYQVVFKITDKPASGGVKLVSFATWNIKVVGPAPIWDQANIGTNHSIQLNWDPYLCATKADSMQVWRKIDSSPYTRVDCVTGMPAGLGYEKIKTVRIGQTAFLDTNKGKGLPPAATVCYRLVALFPAPFGNTEGGAESYVSDEICVGPIPADAPVMTNVTVDTTDRVNHNKGRITVRWTPPFDLDPLIYPPPYTYDVYRATGFSGNISLTKLSSKQTDTVLVDRHINTFDNVFNYRVLVYDNTNTNTVIDTSAIASSVRLQAKSLVKKIELSWTADVPWALRSALKPYHLIYRGGETDTEGQFVKIDSVRASQDILRYTDAGTFNGQVLEENKTYCYRVETRGSYGFGDTSKIPDPLFNYSQIVCARPSDTQKPCKPDVVLEILDCEEYFKTYGCGFNDFSNVLKWNRPTDKNCRDDISFYRIYYATTANADSADYQLLVDLEDHPLDTSYVDRNLPSFARCYKLVAVDHSGNESFRSNEVCNDNCPNYQLPNVFTPDNGDNCNNFFSAYSDRIVNKANGKYFCGGGVVSPDDIGTIQSLCPRFVLKVEITIVDRWGKQVFNYTSGGENSIFIDWDGRDNNGRALSSGVYFYSANVTFETLNPADRVKTIKGWVQLVKSD